MEPFYRCGSERRGVVVAHLRKALVIRHDQQHVGLFRSSKYKGQEAQPCLHCQHVALEEGRGTRAEFMLIFRK